MDDRNAPNRVWMRVVLGRAPVSGPARVPDAYRSSERPIGELRLEVLEFSNCAASSELTAFKCGDSCRSYPRYSSRLSASRIGAAAEPRLTTPTIPHISPLPIRYQPPREAEGCSMPGRVNALATAGGKMA